MSSDSKSAHIRPLSHPTTPLRPSSRSSIRSTAFTHYQHHHRSLNFSHAEGGADDTASAANRHPTAECSLSQPAILSLESQFSELADSIGDLEANFMHLQLMHESLSRFNENFSTFLYGLNMNAFSVDFPEGPIPLSFKQARERQSAGSAAQTTLKDNDIESTFLYVNRYIAAYLDEQTEMLTPFPSLRTTDTSFVDHPQHQPSITTMRSKPTPSTGSTLSPPPPPPSSSSIRGTTRGRGTLPGTRPTRNATSIRGRATTTTISATTTTTTTRASTRRVR
ncbi:DASH complex subunit dam1 [Ascosphaera aggregata]|nr:DASH complex subunit dam1 [Ascosphaera aggregata]